MKKVMLLVVLLLIEVLSAKIKIYTADYPPYQIDDKGKLTGVATEIVQSIFEKAGVECDISYVPWARAQEDVGNRSDANTAIYCLSRTPEREAMYKWVGEYMISKNYFITTKEIKANIKNLDDLKNYNVGLARGDLITETLKKSGKLVKFDEVKDDILNIRKLYEKRVDVIATSDIAAKYIAKQEKLDPSQLVVLSEVPVEYKYNLALSKNTPDDVLKKLQTSMEELKKNGSIDKIIKKYK